jgi:hypothetical protein
MRYFILVRPEPAGQFTAQAVGLPEARATAATKPAAVQQVQALLAQWVASGDLLSVEVPQENRALLWAGHAKDDPYHELYLEEIQRYRQEVDQRQCSSTSSTPIT